VIGPTKGLRTLSTALGDEQAPPGNPPMVGVLAEPGAERRVALVPEVVGKVAQLGAAVIVERGAGAGAHLRDDDYLAAGARLGTAAEVLAAADVLVCVTPPAPEISAVLRSGQVVVGLLRPWERVDDVRHWAESGVTAIALDYLPRTISRAQSMDVLSSQANIAGYRAAVRAADSYGGYFPMLMTAAGTVKPAEVLVLGAGVAGLQAIATARRLGASVAGYDVRPQARAEVASLGARFVDLPGVVSTQGTDGYARELTAEEQLAQRAALDAHIARSDVVITTAQVPGRRPPLLVTASAIAGMRPGSVVVDIAASSYGGNVEVSRPEETVVVDPGVSVIGAGNLASDMAPAAARAYARNIAAVLGAIIADGRLAVPADDDVIAVMTATRDGRVVHAALADLVDTPGGHR
jgi:NAD(P) transhydrogenase subunit alpha